MTSNDPAIDQFDFNGPHAAQFIEMCRMLYDKGLDHGRHDALSSARLACEDAGQTAAATIVGRLMS